ncbi:MAG: alpha/beta fold hydrolase [Woeseiaceae bacterium]|nr:alpha/beta fold hydrolase [Woeseiaceae bacterium]
MRRLFTAFTVIMAATLASGCATEPASRVVQSAQSSECVVLLHGLNRSWRAMQPMARALQDDGYTTVNVDYPSQLGTIQELAPMAVGLGLEQCRSAGASKVHFVTHSMGGILLRYANEQAPIKELGRVVMLGPPNQGSELIDRTRTWPGFAALSGPAGMQLGTSPESIPSQLGPVDFELGVIAGTNTINVLASAMLPDLDDGKVTVKRTMVDGMQDHLVVEDSHRYIVRSAAVLRNTRSFLRTGSFVDLDR